MGITLKKLTPPAPIHFSPSKTRYAIVKPQDKARAFEASLFARKNQAFTFVTVGYNPE